MDNDVTLRQALGMGALIVALACLAYLAGRGLSALVWELHPQPAPSAPAPTIVRGSAVIGSGAGDVIVTHGTIRPIPTATVMEQDYPDT